MARDTGASVATLEATADLGVIFTGGASEALYYKRQKGVM